MRRAAVLATPLLLLAACTSSGGFRTTPPSPPPTAPQSAPSTPLPSPSDSTLTGKGAKIGLILPDASSRWRTAEHAALQSACAAANLDCVIEDAGGSAPAMASIAADMQASGVRILVLVPLDRRSTAAVERTARSNGVLTVEYDRHVPNGSAAAFVRPDTRETGRLIGDGVTACRPAGDPTGGVPYLRVDAPAKRVGVAAQQAATRRIVRQTPGWQLIAAVPAHDGPTARAAVGPLLRNFVGVRAVLAPSDGTAAGVIAALAAQHRAGDVAVSGNGATVVGLQHVLAGTQCFTVYHPPAAGAAALAKVLVRLVNYRPVNTAGSLPAAGGRRTALVQYSGAQIVTRDDVKAVIDSGYVRRGDVCSGAYAARCAAAGI